MNTIYSNTSVNTLLQMIQFQFGYRIAATHLKSHFKKNLREDGLVFKTKAQSQLYICTKYMFKAKIN